MTEMIRSAMTLGAVSLFLASCMSLAPKPDRSRFFTLSSLSPMNEAAVKNPTGLGGVSIGIGPLKFPGYLDRQEIVVRSDQNRLEVSENDRWAESLEENFRRVLVQDLAALLGTDRIIAFPWPANRKPKYQIEIEVLSFEANSARDAGLAARWVVIDGGSGKPLRFQESRLTRPAKEKTTDAMVAALSETVEALSREMADTIRVIDGGMKP
jgi:uncharacterized lipoprotein YmbA